MVRLMKKFILNLNGRLDKEASDKMNAAYDKMVRDEEHMKTEVRYCKNCQHYRLRYLETTEQNRCYRKLVRKGNYASGFYQSYKPKSCFANRKGLCKYYEEKFKRLI